MTRLALRSVVVDLWLVGLALTDALLSIHWGGTPMQYFFGVVASVGLLLRRRFPFASLLLALPQLFVSASLVAAAIALFFLARSSAKINVVVVAAMLLFVGNMWTVSYVLTIQDLILDAVYSALTAIGPAALGWALRTREELAHRIAELALAREAERSAVVAQTLSQERARLAREMHDVVSHQVSLIAVQTGALQVSTKDPAVQATAGGVRALAVQTLDELRQMVGVLRAAGGETAGIDPQPTAADLARLIEDSDIDVISEIDLPETAPIAVQRAVYRTVQEGLTNARKHAPGAIVTVRVTTVSAAVRVEVENTAPNGARLELPSAGHGLIGLGERAELLGGRMEFGPTASGGHRLMLDLPLRGMPKT